MTDVPETLKVGVIGAGFIGPIHVEAVRRTFLAEVVALAGSNQEAAERKASQYGVPRAYGDYRDLLADDAIDVVHICTPNNLHFSMARDALRAGKHVVCEKPLTLTRSEAEQLVQLAEWLDLVNAVHFNVRYYPLVREARELVRSGATGRLFAIYGSYLQDWLFYDTDYSWRLEPELSGTSRAIADIGSHWLDLVEYVSQLRVTEVLADFATFHPTRKKPLRPIETWSGKLVTAEDYEEVPIETEDYASVLLHFDKGGHGVVTVNQMAAGHKNRVAFEMDGARVALGWDSQRPNELFIGHRDQANQVLLRDPALVSPPTRSIIAYPGGHNEGFPDTSKHLFREVYQAILSGSQRTEAAPAFPTFRDGYREVVLCEAILASVRTRGWVSVM